MGLTLKREEKHELIFVTPRITPTSYDPELDPISSKIIKIKKKHETLKKIKIKITKPETV